MIKELGLKAKTAVVELQDGKNYRMDFDMGALANAEGVYEEHFGKPVGIDTIISELVQGRTRALMAITYGAMISAGENLTWRQFGKSIYTFENYHQLSETVTDALLAMMGSQDESTEDGSKNASSRGEN